MALKNCKECGNGVSTKAKTCPKCGAPVKQDSSFFGCLGIGIIGLILMVFFGSNSNDNNSKTTKTNWREHTDSTAAYIMMEDFVKNRLKSPSTAVFPAVSDGRDGHVAYLGNQKYIVRSYVDSQNSFGATVRNNFTGEIVQVEEERWRLVSLDIVPR